MDRQLASLQLSEAGSQCRFAIIASELLAQAEQMPMRPGVSRNEYFWFAVQGILIAGGNLKNLLYTGISGNGDEADAARAAQIADRKPLREAIQLADDSCLSRAPLRNSLEHFDDRIARWHRKTKTGNVSIRGISKGGNVVWPDGMDFLGHYDRDTGNVTFWDNGTHKTQNAHEIVAECRRILPLIEAEARRLIQEEMRERAEPRLRELAERRRSEQEGP